jgi:hypothetical protein
VAIQLLLKYNPNDGGSMEKKNDADAAVKWK